MKLILTNAHLIDCINPTPIPGASVTTISAACGW